MNIHAIIIPLFSNASTIVKLEIKGNIGPASNIYLKEGTETTDKTNRVMFPVPTDLQQCIKGVVKEYIANIL